MLTEINCSSCKMEKIRRLNMAKCVHLRCPQPSECGPPAYSSDGKSAEPLRQAHGDAPASACGASHFLRIGSRSAPVLFSRISRNSWMVNPRFSSRLQARRAGRAERKNWSLVVLLDGGIAHGCPQASDNTHPSPNPRPEKGRRPEQRARL
jgi:hypothetical protein